MFYKNSKIEDKMIHATEGRCLYSIYLPTLILFPLRKKFKN